MCSDYFSSDEVFTKNFNDLKLRKNYFQSQFRIIKPMDISQLTQVNSLVLTLTQQWAKVKPVLGSFLGGLDSTALNKTMNYLYGGIDQMVALVEKFDVPGVDKKQAVIDGANTLFNALIAAELPTSLKWCLTPIQKVFDSMLDAAIEFAVSKLVK